MRSRAVRVTLALLALAAIGAAAYEIVKEEHARAAIREDLDRVERDARDLQVLASDIRAAQQGYVAAGQGDAFWKQRVTTLVGQLDVALSDFESIGETDETRAAITSAREAVGRFRKVDERARHYLAAGQRLLASDAIFADGIEATTAVAGRIEAARMAEIAARDVAMRRARRVEAWSLSVAAAVSVLVLLLLAPIPLGAGGESNVARSADTALDGPHELYLTPPPKPVRPDPAVVDVDLAAAAGLCTDLGRVVEGGQLPAILQRAAVLLGADGLIVWMLDRDCEELRPVLAQGYSAEVVSQLGTIARDADNATAAAFRTIATQVVPSNGTAHGAIVAPLVTSAGCVGVLAVETRNGFETRASVRAITAIFAAQLAALVGTDPPAADAMAQAQA